LELSIAYIVPMRRPNLVILLTLAPLIAVLVAAVVWLAVDIVRYHGSLPHQRSTTFTVKDVRYEGHHCLRTSCTHNASVIRYKGRTYRYDSHYIKVGDRCTTRGRTDELASCEAGS
jgi:hypothetical protein